MKKIIPAFLLLLFIASCQKYEDGPTLSLRTKTHRLVNTWSVESVMENGVDVTNDFNAAYPDYMLTITKENTYVLTYMLNSGVEYKENGTWIYSGDKVHLYFSNLTGGSAEDWKILRLKEKEFWAEHTETNQSTARVYEVHFKPAF